MVIKRVDTLRSEEELSNRFQDNSNDALNNLFRVPIIDGTFAVTVGGDRAVTTIPLVAGQSNLVAHRLARNPLGFFLADLDTDTNVWRVPVVDEIPQNRFLDLRCGTDCTVKVWVF